MNKLSERYQESIRKWMECITTVCNECQLKYKGRQFAAVRHAIEGAKKDEVCPGPEVYIVELSDLDKVTDDGAHARMTKFKSHDPFLRARWTVEDENYILAHAGLRPVKRPPQKLGVGEEFKVFVNAISQCRCKLIEEGEKGNLFGPHAGDVFLPRIEGETTSDGEEETGDQSTYFAKKKITIERNAMNDEIENEGSSAAAKKVRLIK